MSEQLALGREGTSPNTSVEGYRPKAGTSTAPAATGNDTGYLRVFVFALFFFFGGITSLNDVIIPRLKELFTLS
jgi:FHS family L-fucose permease-like MFS transporter